MKKVLAIVLALSILFAFAACSSKEYVDVVVTKPVTDTDGKNVTNAKGETVFEPVTDKNGKVVTTSVDKSVTNEKDITIATAPSGESDSIKSTENSSANSESEKNTDKKEKTTGKAEKTTKKTTEKTTAKKDDSKNKTTEKTTSATKPVTQKPKKRMVKINVELPFYNNVKTTMTVSYKVEGDKEFKQLEPKKIVLDGAKVVQCEIGKLKGKVTVKVALKGIKLTNNVVEFESTYDGEDQEKTISVVTGIEAMQGEND